MVPSHVLVLLPGKKPQAPRAGKPEQDACGQMELWI